MHEILRKTLTQHSLFPAHETIVLAVSGGADSLALLHALIQLGETIPNQYHVATLDHGLRGEAGAEDAAFVRDFAAQYGLPCTVGKADVARLAQVQGIGIEEAARIARYDFLTKVAEEVGSRTIATGHHADDQAETILMHILRGSGLLGLRGMPYLSNVPGHLHLRLVRPLLDVPRSLIEAYCAEHGLAFRQDESNFDPGYTRNRIRLKILPLLRTVNPQVEAALLRLSQSAVTDESYLEEQFESQILPKIAQEAGRFSWQTNTFLGWHPAMQQRVVRYAVQQLGAQPEYEQVIRACEGAGQAGVGLKLSFNNDVRLRIGYEQMYIELETAPMPAGDYWLLTEETAVSLPGITSCRSWQLIAHTEAQPDTAARLAILPDATVTLRTRRPGDRWKPLGMDGHSRTVKKWMIDQKIPQHVRDHLPLLLVDDEIAAVILPDQWSIAETFAVRSWSQHVFYFSVSGL